MCILDKEFKKRDRKKVVAESKKKEYKPRLASLLVGKHDKKEPLPSYWSLR